MDILGLFHYWVFAILLMTGFYAVLTKRNYIKKLLGLAIFQSAVFLLYVSMGRIDGGTAPILLPSTLDASKAGTADSTVYSNPLPQVLILTAIVVGISTLALGLAIVVRIQEAYGSVEGEVLDEAEGTPPSDSLIGSLRESLTGPTLRGDGP